MRIPQIKIPLNKADNSFLARIDRIVKAYKLLYVSLQLNDFKNIVRYSRRIRYLNDLNNKEVTNSLLLFVAQELIETHKGKEKQ